MNVCTKCGFLIVGDAAACSVPDCKISFHPKCADLEGDVPAAWCCSTECKEKFDSFVKCFVCRLPVKPSEKKWRCSGKAQCPGRRHEICVGSRCGACSKEEKPKVRTCFKCSKDIVGDEDSYSCIECDRHFHEVCTAPDGMHCTSCSILRVDVVSRQSATIAKQNSTIANLEAITEATLKKYEELLVDCRKNAEESANLKSELATLTEKLSKLGSSEEPKDNLIKLKERFFKMDDFCYSDSDEDEDNDGGESEPDDDLQEFLLQSPFADGSPEMANAYKYRKQNYDLPTFSGGTREWPAFVTRFKTSTRKGNFSDDENADRLREALKGDAVKYAGASLQFTTSGAEVMRNLKKFVGRPEIISVQLADALMELKKCTSISDKNIIDFASELATFVRTLTSMGWQTGLNNKYLLNKLELKLSDIHYDMWAQKRTKYEARKHEAVSLEYFSSFLNSIATRFPLELMDGGGKGADEHKRDRHRNLNYHGSSTPNDSVSDCPFCCGEHALGDCNSFRKLNVDERCDFVFKNDVCSNCLLNTKHSFGRCNVTTCADCGGRHNTILHGARKTKGG